MNPSKNEKALPVEEAEEQPRPAAHKADPDLVEGLKHLYGSVVNEPLPTALQELLDKLDDGEEQ